MTVRGATDRLVLLNRIRKLSEHVYGDQHSAFDEYGFPDTDEEAAELHRKLVAIRQGTQTKPAIRPDPKPASTEEPMPDKTTTKYCPDCDAEKPVTEFGKNRSARDGLSSYCSEHMRERSRKSAAKKRKKSPKRKDPASAENKRKVEASVQAGKKPDPEPDPPLSPSAPNGDLRAVLTDPRASQLLELQEIIETNFDTVPSLENVIGFAADLASFGAKGADE